MSGAPLPLTYDESRARFRHAARNAGDEPIAHAIDARGPFGQRLTVDVARLGATAPQRVLVVLSGVHGVEGFAPAAAQCALLDDVAHGAAEAWPDDLAVLVVHAVNPWGMAHGRRQNESNVDLNRNWGRSTTEPVHNDAYDEIHSVACPDTDELPDADAMLGDVVALSRERSAAWTRHAITAGQFRHPDGLHFGGDETEPSVRILEHVVDDLGDIERVFVLDLHTGHGAWGDTTYLSSAAVDSAEHDFLVSAFGEVETTSESTASSGPKSGLISRGMAERPAGVIGHAVVMEVGTADDMEQLVATYHEQWVHRRGDPDDPAHRAAQWRYRCCFTPDDTEWQERAVESYRTSIAAAIDAVAAWT